MTKPFKKTLALQGVFCLPEDNRESIRSRSQGLQLQLGAASFNWQIFSKKKKLKTKNFKNEVILYVFNFHKLWKFSMYSQKYRRMIKDLYFIFGL
jgi:hypothetical protein